MNDQGEGGGGWILLSVVLVVVAIMLGYIIYASGGK